MTEPSADERVRLAWRIFEVLSSGDVSVVDEFIHPDFVNHEARDEPPAARTQDRTDSAQPSHGFGRLSRILPALRISA
jgi:ketosteroid isomerase-like protein